MAHASLESSGHGHMDPALRLTMNRNGLWLFILSESMIFLLLLIVRFVLAGSGHPAELNQPLALGMTVILIASGWTARKAHQSTPRRSLSAAILSVARSRNASPPLPCPAMRMCSPGSAL